MNANIPSGGMVIQVLLTAALILVSARTTPEQAGLSPLRQAESHFAAGEFTAAEVAFREAVTLLPRHAYPQHQLSVMYLQWNRPHEGLAVWGTMPDGDPWLHLQLLSSAGQWTALETTAQQLLQIAPNDERAHAGLVQALLQQSRCADAEEAAAIWAQHTTDAEAIWTSAALHDTRNPLLSDSRVCDLDAELCAALQTCTGEAECMRQLGEALLQRRKPALALCALAKAIEYAPQDARAHAWLGAAQEQMSDSDAALAHFQQATTLAPDDPLGWLLLGMAHFNRRNYTDAWESLLRAQALDPANPLPCLAVAGVLAAQSNYTDIPIWTTAALERAQEDAEIWKATAQFYLIRNLALEGEPLHAAEGAVRLASQDAESWMLLGWAQFNEQEYVAALVALQTSLTYDARQAEAYHFMGLTLGALGRHVEAETALIRAADLGYGY